MDQNDFMMNGLNVRILYNNYIWFKTMLMMSLICLQLIAKIKWNLWYDYLYSNLKIEYSQPSINDKSLIKNYPKIKPLPKIKQSNYVYPYIAIGAISMVIDVMILNYK